MKKITLSILGCAALAIAGTANAAVITLDAIDTASARTSGEDLNGDNRLRAYHTDFSHIDGWMKFDFSAVPDAATITGMTLTLYAEGAFGTPVGSPESIIYRSSHDAWSRGGVGFPTSYDQALTALDSGPFSGTRGTPYDFVLDVGAVDWSGDLTDDLLSLIVSQEQTSGSHYMYWFGSDCVADGGDANSGGDFCDYRPELTIEYSLLNGPVDRIPAPLPLAVMGLGLLGLAGLRRRA